MIWINRIISNIYYDGIFLAKPHLTCRVFPNPVVRNLNIRMENVSGDQAHIRISKLGGVTVHEVFLRLIPGDFFTSISLENRPPGIYLLSIRTEGQFFVEKIIKVRE